MVMSPRPERLWENVTRPILAGVTLCYVRFECFSLLRNSGIINGSEISNLQNWTVGLGASRKNAFGPEGWAAIPACFIPICAGACACMGHSYETPELLMAQKSATCKIGPSDFGASRKNAFGPEGWAAIPACFIPICAGACACMGHWIVRSSRNHYWIQTDRVL